MFGVCLIEMNPARDIIVNVEEICTAICDIAAYFNSDFDDDHDSPKGEVNPNVLSNFNDVSDIFKHFVDDKGVSSCLKSLWKTTLGRFHLSL